MRSAGQRARASGTPGARSNASTPGPHSASPRRGSNPNANDDRVIKQTWAPTRNTLYVFDSLELRRAEFVSSGSPPVSEYDLTKWTEVPYLFVNGVRVARIVYHDSTPEIGGDQTHIFFELGDHLGSTNIVIDKVTGELVERGTYQAYGVTESDYRPGRWEHFREDYKFTGKEEDVEVGLQYFGKRFLSAHLQRWVSADPLGVHSPGSADLNLYAYVSGQPLKSVDPQGLCGSGQECNPTSGSQGQGNRAAHEQTSAPPTSQFSATRQATHSCKGGSAFCDSSGNVVEHATYAGAEGAGSRAPASGTDPRQHFNLDQQSKSAIGDAATFTACLGGMLAGGLCAAGDSSGSGYTREQAQTNLAIVGMTRMGTASVKSGGMRATAKPKPAAKSASKKPRTADYRRRPITTADDVAQARVDLKQARAAREAIKKQLAEAKRDVVSAVNTRGGPRSTMAEVQEVAELRQALRSARLRVRSLRDHLQHLKDLYRRDRGKN